MILIGGTNMILFLMPTYNRFGLGMLQRSVHSILSQEEIEFKLIVVDDCSTDGTFEYLADLASKDKRLQVVTLQKNICLPALTLLDGFLMRSPKLKYLAWAPDDVEWLPGSANKMLRRIQETDADIVHGQTHIQLPNGEYLVHGCSVDWKLQTLGQNQIGQAATLTKISSLEGFGFPDPAIILKRYNDWDMWVRAYKFGCRFEYLEEIMVVENGWLLQSSLGMSSIDLSDIALLFSQTERSQKLQPKELRNRSLYDWPRAATSQQKERILLAFVQHHIRTNSWQEFLQERNPDLLDLLESMGLTQLNFMEQIQRLFDKEFSLLHNKVGELTAQLLIKQKFIDNQRIHIDEKQSLIDEQRSLIDQQQIAISQLTKGRKKTKEVQ